MKKTIYYLLSLLALTIQACSTSDNSSNNAGNFLQKYNNSFWKNDLTNPIEFDYYGFKNDFDFLQIVYIEPANNNQLVCVKSHEGVNSTYSVQITKNQENELWVKIYNPDYTDELRFIVNPNTNKLTLIRFTDNVFENSETYSLTNLNYGAFCN